MLYVQITAGFRAAFGLQTNPSLMGRRLVVTGTLTAYFSHGGLKSPTAMTPGRPGTARPTADRRRTGPIEHLLRERGRQDRHRAAQRRCTRSSECRPSSPTTRSGTRCKDTDQDPNNSNNVILLYSGRSQSKTINGGGVDDWNREHVWAKSHGDFGTATGPGTDVHHLRPEDVTVNSTRGNKDFDNGGTAVARRRAAGPTPTRSNRGTRSRATWPG